MEDSVAQAPESDSNSNIWIGIFSVLVIIVLSLSAYFYFQTKKLNNSTVKPTPTISDEIINKGPVPGKEPFYTFDCPPDSSYTIDKTAGDGIKKPLVQVTCTGKTDPNKKVRIYTMSAEGKEIAESGFTFIKSYDSKSGKEKVFISGNDQTLFDQVVTSFKFTE